MYVVPVADPLTALEGQARLHGKHHLADGIALARRNLPPAIAQLVADELRFHAGNTWLGASPKLRELVDELTTMDAARGPSLV